MSNSKLIFAIEHVADSLSSSNYELSKVIGSCTDSIISSNDKVIEGLSVISDTINSPRPYDWLMMGVTVVLSLMLWRTTRIQGQRQIGLQKEANKQERYKQLKQLYDDTYEMESYISSFMYDIYLSFVAKFNYDIQPNYNEKQDIVDKLISKRKLIIRDSALLLKKNSYNESYSYLVLQTARLVCVVIDGMFTEYDHAVKNIKYDTGYMKNICRKCNITLGDDPELLKQDVSTYIMGVLGDVQDNVKLDNDAICVKIKEVMDIFEKKHDTIDSFLNAKKSYLNSDNILKIIETELDN